MKITQLCVKRLRSPQCLWVFVSALFVMGLSALGSSAQTVGWKPEKNVELIVAATAGGGADLTARTIQNSWQAMGMVAISTVVNKAGGGGGIAYSYLTQHAGNGHYLAISTPNLLTNPITGTHPIGHRDVTPISLLFSEYLAFNVKADSPIARAGDLVDRLKKDPGSLSVGLSPSLGGVTHIATALAMKAAGVDTKKMKFVVFKSGGESAVALLGGHVDLSVSSASLVVPYMNAGKLRIIAISAPKRAGGALANVPTWREQGIDSVSVNWRASIAPKGLSQAQVAFWEDVFGKVVETNEWKQSIEKNLWASSYLNSKDTRAYLDAQYDELKAVLTDLGLAK